MAGVSTESLDALTELFEQRFAADANTTISAELFSVATALDGDGSLRRGLTDPSRDPEQRRGIAAMVLEGKVYPVVRELVAFAAASRWSAERDLADALERLGLLAAAAAAERRGGAPAVQAVIEDLLRFANTVQAQPEVQSALTDQRAGTPAKKALAAAVAPARTPEGTLLVDQIVSHPRGVEPAALAERFATALVEQSRRSIAKVTVSHPLDASRRERLGAALNRIYGRELTLDVTVDPQILGGIKIQVGDEVIDGSVLARVSDLDRTVTAGS